MLDQHDRKKFASRNLNVSMSTDINNCFARISHDLLIRSSSRTKMTCLRPYTFMQIFWCSQIRIVRSCLCENVYTKKIFKLDPTC